MKSTKEKSGPLDHYEEQAVNLSTAFNELRTLQEQRARLQAEVEKTSTRRHEILSESVTGDTEAAVIELAKQNARAEVFEAKLRHLQGQTEIAEHHLQLTLISEFGPGFSTLYQSLRNYRITLAHNRIAEVVHPANRQGYNNSIDVLAAVGSEVVELASIEPRIPSDCATPLRDNDFVPHGRWHDQTLGVIMTAAEYVLNQAPKLIAAAQNEEGFIVPAIPPQVAQPGPHEPGEAGNMNFHAENPELQPLEAMS
jgi:hypothetical protein